MTRQNVILIFLDDTHYSGFDKMGRLVSKTNGVTGDWARFDRAYVNYAHCGPSRFGLLCGRYARHTGVFGHGTSASVATPGTDAWGDEHVAPTWLPVALQRAGVATAAFGKMPNRHPYAKGDDYVPPGFDKVDTYIEDSTLGGAHATHDGPQYFQFFHYDQDPGIAFEGLQDTWTTKGPGGAYSLTSGSRGVPGRSIDTVTDYATDYFSAALQKWLLGDGPAGETFHEPFFAMVWPKAAHNGTKGRTGATFDSLGLPDQPVPAIRHNTLNYAAYKSDGTASANAAGANEIPFTQSHSPSWDEADITDKPTWLQWTYPAQLSTQSKNVVDIWQLAQWRTLQAVDEMIGDLVALLTVQQSPNPDTGELEPTIDHTTFVIGNDNGFAMGEHRAHGKTIPYEPAIRTNVFVRHPGMLNPLQGGPGGHTDSALVSVVDIAPTIADAMGVPPLISFDGMSLLPRADDPALPWRRDLRVEYNGNTAGGDQDDTPTHDVLLSWYPDIPPSGGGSDATGKLWKYVDLRAFVMPVGADSHVGETVPAEAEMYDLEATGADADEQTNRVKVNPDPVIATELKRRMDAVFAL